MSWQFYHGVTLPERADANYFDVVLPPSVFDQSRHDLADLRLYDAQGAEIPYALRELRSEYEMKPFPLTEFNRSRGENGVSEVSLDLAENNAEHNEIEVQLAGDNFRRKVILEASDDTSAWRHLATKNLVRFHSADKMLVDQTVGYPPSRYRYLRLRVFRDAEVDDGPVAIGKVSVNHRVEIPGEMLWRSGQLGPREPVRTSGVPGSAWIVDLGGDNVPCESIEVQVSDADFVRDYEIEAGGPPGTDRPFFVIARGQWRRRAGDEQRPLVATFAEIRAARLRLTILDHRNQPLSIQSLRSGAPARQIVFAAPTSPDRDLRLYFGNPRAERTEYDFARNLPARLDPPPARCELSPRMENPSYTPEPLPLTERWPWLIYIVLISVSIVLGLIIVNLSRMAIEIHDKQPARPSKVPTSSEV